MLDIRLDIPLWAILLFTAIFAAWFALSGVGIYYLISKKFDKVALITSAVIFFALIIPKSLDPYDWRVFIKLNSTNLVGLFGLVLTYLAIFSAVNFIYRLFCKIALK